MFNIFHYSAGSPSLFSICRCPVRTVRFHTHFQSLEMKYWSSSSRSSQSSTILSVYRCSIRHDSTLEQRQHTYLLLTHTETKTSKQTNKQVSTTTILAMQPNGPIANSALKTIRPELPLTSLTHAG